MSLGRKLFLESGKEWIGGSRAESCGRCLIVCVHVSVVSVGVSVDDIDNSLTCHSREGLLPVYAFHSQLPVSKVHQS